MVAKVSFNYCQFEKQKIKESYEPQHGGVAIHIRNFQLPVYVPHTRPLLEVEFSNCTFRDNIPKPNASSTSLYAAESHNGVLFIQGIDSATFSGCMFVNNNCSGIVSIQSLLIIRGENIIHNNTGVRGGGMVLCSRSIIFLHNNSLLNITENRAKEFGGGIYVESECDQDVPHCFFQVNNTHITFNDTRVSLVNNTALAVMVVVVGQRNGTAPGAVKAIAGTNTSLGSLQTTQDVTVSCTPLNYTVYTSLSRTKIELRVQHSLLSPAPTLKINRTFVKVNLKGCPIGFVLSSGTCTCSETLAGKPGVDCFLEPYPTIRRSSYSWIGYHNSSDPSKSGIIYQKYCPSGYCHVGTVDINSSEISFEQNSQCAHFRMGLLCGSCPPNMSAIFGSPKCKVCSNKFLSLIIALAVAGVALVAFLNLSNLTVTSGEINGLTFYANVMQITLKNVSKTDGVIFSFISWLNLDLGVHTCFYNGMDAFGKVFLQFVFPTYLFALAFLIIFLCRKYQRLANCMGNNAVKVLATLFFISYAKLLRIIVLVFNVSIFTYPDNSSEWRWTEDGSILFARGKHLALVVCGFGAVCFSLPFTAILTFHPCMQRSSKKCFKWIHRLKPLLDAYSGVYKDRYRFWTGLLLFARLYLFLTFAVDVHQISYYKSLSVLFVCLLVLSLGWMFGGVYKDCRLDVLEASYIINLALFSGASLNGSVSQERIAEISIGVAFATFLFTLIWKFRTLRVFKRVAAFVSQREDATVGTVPSRNISWFSISDHHGEGNDGSLDRESQPLLP
ncbi:hypothetical protein GBAR_LOCUS14347 [Geodia barretti]|uniref:Uncharacterized protein n=1 Tax=Geodia barretti TaxID=519541 RepID=A0AA35WS78_GEOBA|nr:hypothetical protein GBAR_LOCUS14347 [Geodia barretti]